MALDTSSQANDSGIKTDSKLQQAAGDLQAGQLNNQVFSQDISALYTRDQGHQDQLKADLVALNQQLQANKILPNLLLVGADGNGDLIYDDPVKKQISVVDSDNKVVDSGTEQDMLAKLQNQTNAGDQGANANDQSNGQAQSGGQDQSLAQAQNAGQDQSSSQSQSDGQDQNRAQSQGDDRPAPAADTSDQAETWGQHGRQYSPTPGQDGEYTHVVEQFQGDDKPGDTMYRIASDSLDKQHDNDPNYQPSDQAVTGEIQRIAAYNEDAGTIGQPPEYTIRVGDIIKIPPKDWTAPDAEGRSEGTGSANQGAGDSMAASTPPAASDLPQPDRTPPASAAIVNNDAPPPSNSTAPVYAPTVDDAPPSSNAPGVKDAPAANYAPGIQDAPPSSYTPNSSDTPPYGYTPGTSDAPPSSYPPNSSDATPYGYTPGTSDATPYGYTPGTSDATPYGYTQGAGGPPPYEYQPAPSGPNGYAYATRGDYIPPYNYAPTAYEPTAYGYAPNAYDAPPYGYAPSMYETPFIEPRATIEVNPVGLVRTVARLFRK